MRFNKPYIKVRDYAIKALKNGWEFGNPFADFGVFEATGFELDGDDLLQIFFDKFEELKIAKPLPPKDYEVIYNMQVVKLDTEQLRYEYVWSWLSTKIKDYLVANYRPWKDKVDAFLESYKPLENYNMVELGGGTSLTARVRSSSGTHKTTSKVAPFDSETFKNETEVTTSQSTLNGTDFASDSAVSGFDDATKTLTFDTLTTPQGNSTSVSKLTRSGNIGVTTSQQMLEAELEVKSRDLVKEFMNEVANVCLLSDWK